MSLIRMKSIRNFQRHSSLRQGVLGHPGVFFD